MSIQVCVLNRTQSQLSRLGMHGKLKELILQIPRGVLRYTWGSGLEFACSDSSYKWSFAF